MENPTGLIGQIESEIRDYFSSSVDISEGVNFSMPKLIKRIGLFQSHTYPTGKIDKAGNYKFWMDIATSRVDAEVKNTDMDTKNIKVDSDRTIDAFPVIVVNLKLKDYLKKEGHAEELNASREEGAGWGNVVWKKVNKGYERVDLKNFYVINQTAKTLEETPAIERHQLSQSDLRGKTSWKNVQETIKECKENVYKETPETQGKDTTTPYYEIYERNGEVNLRDLKLANDKELSEGDEEKYVLARVIVSATKGTGQNSNPQIKYILFADELKKKMSDVYKEYHRGPYKGRWWREGVRELLFDCQVRANQIGNQIAQGLEYASKTWFQSPDKLIVQNILSDMKNGDFLKGNDIRQIEVRMQGFDQLIADWNRNLQLANDICNSQEVIQGVTPASGTPLGTSQMLNFNANKLFDFIREKFSIPISEMFEEWIVPGLIDELKMQDVISLTGDTETLNRAIALIVDEWYIKNLIALGPHDPQMAMMLKEQKALELQSKPKLLVKGMEDMWEGFKKALNVDIHEERSTVTEDSQTLTQLINLEADPVRRSAMLDIILKNKGFDVAKFPRFQPPVQQQPRMAAQPQ